MPIDSSPQDDRRERRAPAGKEVCSMRRSRQRIGLSKLRLVALALSVVTTAELSPAKATDVPPLRVIKDQDPNFDTLWVDLVNNEILVGNDAQETLQVYSRSAQGVVAPLREIKGEATFITYPGQVIVDPAHNEIWSVGNDISDLITVYSRTAVGNVAPIRRIDGKKSQLKFNRSWGIALDTANDELFATHQKRNQISVFARTMNTDTDPKATAKRTIQGPATGLAEPHGIFVDAERHEIVVADGSPTDALLFFDQKASGNAAPIRIIQGSDTGLSNPTGVFVDAKHDEVLVANWSNHTITVYSRGAGGNVKPIRVISPTRSRVSVGIGNPGAIYVDPERDEIGVPN